MFNPIKEELKATGKLVSTERFIFDESKKTIVGYEINLTNIGMRSLSDIYIGISSLNGKLLFPDLKKYIETIPVIPFTYKSEGHRAYIHIPQTLKSHDEIIVFIAGLNIPADKGKENLLISVSSSEGYVTNRKIFTNSGFFELFYDKTNGWKFRHNTKLRKIKLSPNTFE